MIIGATPDALGDYWLVKVIGFSVGILLLALAALISISSHVYERIVGAVYGATHVIDFCSKHEVEIVHHFAKTFFGNEVTDPEKIHLIIRKYRNGLRIAKKFTDEGVSIIAYIFYFPINKSTVEKIHKYEFDVKDLKASDIASHPRYGYAMYIGAIAGRGVVAKAQMLSVLMDKQDEAKKTKTKTVYARAASRDGLRLLKKRGFKPVHTKADDVECFFMKVVA